MNVNVMVGMTVEDIKCGSDEIVFKMANGRRFRLYHGQDCCEYVRVEDVCGDWDDLIGRKLLVSEEVNSNPPHNYNYTNDSYTWTFYRFASERGWVVVRWLGESNGYYSEAVDFVEIREKIRIPT